MTVDADSVAVLVVVIVIAIDRVLGMLRARGIDLQKMSRQIDRLAEQHNTFDEDGVPVWYVRRSLEKTLDNLQDAIRAQTDLLKELAAEMRAARDPKPASRREADDG